MKNIGEDPRKHRGEGTQTTECLCDYAEYIQWGCIGKWEKRVVRIQAKGRHEET